MRERKSFSVPMAIDLLDEVSIDYMKIVYWEFRQRLSF